MRAAWRTVVAALLVTGFLSASGASIPITATAATAAATDPAPVAVSLSEISPTVVRPDSDLTVVATLTNTSDRLTLDGSAMLSIERILMLTRSSVSAWSDRAASDPVGSALDTVPVSLDPGQRTSVSFSISASRLGLLATTAGWGPRGIAVSVSGTLAVTADSQGDPASSEEAESITGQLGAARSFVLWQPVDDSEITPVSVAVTVPVTGLASGLASDTQPGGRLDRLVAATEASPAASWVVDPALLSTALQGADSGTAADDGTGSTPPASTAKAWADRLQSHIGDRDMYALPAFDPDVELTSDTVLEPSSELAAAVKTLTQGWRTGLILPAQDAPTRKVAVAAAAATGGVVVARSGYQPEDELTYTPSGVTTVSSQDETATVLVADPTLTELFVAPSDDSPPAARQRLLAELAVISRERPAQARSLLVALPRDWDAEPAIAKAQLAALDSAAWTTSIPVSTLSAVAPDEITRKNPKAADRPGALAAGDWKSAVGNAKRVTTFARIAADPESLSGPIRDSTLALSSVAWESDPDSRRSASVAVHSASTSLLTSQSVVIGSDVNLISAAGSLPVTLRNDLDQSVTLTVRLAPDDPRLSAEELDDVTIEAQSQTSVEIPVTAVGSGDVTVDVRLVGPTGEVLATPASFRVRVRAGWEGLGTAVIGGLLALALVFGIWRTIRRGRAQSRTTDTAIVTEGTS